MLMTLRKCGQDQDKIQGRFALQRNFENSLCWWCFWLNNTYTTTSNHSCSPQAAVSWRGPSDPEPGRLWKKVPPGSIITSCTVPELCSQKPCGDMANPNLLAPIGSHSSHLVLEKECHWTLGHTPSGQLWSLLLGGAQRRSLVCR